MQKTALSYRPVSPPLRALHINGFVLLALVAMLSVGCGSDDHAEHETTAPAAEAGHEGHNHGPGEHGHAHGGAFEEGTVEREILADWCQEHSVPESACTQCNPALIPDFKATGDWCAGHDLPESHCRLCNPEIVFPQEEVLRTRASEFTESEIAVSLFHRPNASVCATDGALIQFASTTTADRAGLSLQAVRAADYEATVEAPAEVVFDESGATVVTSTVDALVSRWMRSPGDVVRRGDVLAIVQSPEIASLRSALLSAHAEYRVQQNELKRHEELHARDFVSEADLERRQALTERARAEYVGARGMLLSAGLNAADLDDVLNHGSLSNQFALRAPADGVLVERRAQLGELLDAGQAFAMLAEPSAMWIEARLTEEQLRRVSVGDPLIFGSDGRGLSRVGGEVIWVSRFLDPHTRTGTVRARVVDPDHGLQAGEFGQATIVERSDEPVTLVPRDAVQWEGCCNVVFVRETDQRYRPRKVELLERRGPYYQVSSGLQVGEEVVVNGAFLLKTELKKTSIGAGCCGLDPVG